MSDHFQLSAYREEETEYRETNTTLWDEPDMLLIERALIAFLRTVNPEEQQRCIEIARELRGLVEGNWRLECDWCESKVPDEGKLNMVKDTQNTSLRICDGCFDESDPRRHE